LRVIFLFFKPSVEYIFGRHPDLEVGLWERFFSKDLANLDNQSKFSFHYFSTFLFSVSFLIPGGVFIKCEFICTEYEFSFEQVVLEN